MRNYKTSCKSFYHNGQRLYVIVMVAYEIINYKVKVLGKTYKVADKIEYINNYPNVPNGGHEWRQETASKAARKINQLFKAEVATYKDITDFIEREIVGSIQYQVDREYHKDTINAFKDELFRLLQKYNLGVSIEEFSGEEDDTCYYPILTHAVGETNYEEDLTEILSDFPNK